MLASKPYHFFGTALSLSLIVCVGSQQLRRGEMDSSRCCCCSIRIGTIIVGIFEFLGLLIALIAVIAFYSEGGVGSVSVRQSNGFPPRENSTSLEKHVQVGSATAGLACTIIAFVIGTVSIVGLLIGLIKNKAILILAHLIIQALAILGLLISVVVYALYASNTIKITDQELTPDHVTVIINGQEVPGGTPDPDALKNFQDSVKDARETLAIISCVFFSIAFFVEIYCASVVFKCYRYVKSAVQ